MDELDVVNYNDIWEHANELLKLIKHVVSDGREKALAITKLDECVMWLEKARLKEL